MKMPFGTYEGADIDDVPATYLLMLDSTKDPRIDEYDGLRAYIEENRAALDIIAGDEAEADEVLGDG